MVLIVLLLLLDSIRRIAHRYVVLRIVRVVPVLALRVVSRCSDVVLLPAVSQGLDVEVSRQLRLVRAGVLVLRQACAVESCHKF